MSTLACSLIPMSLDKMLVARLIHEIYGAVILHFVLHGHETWPLILKKRTKFVKKVMRNDELRSLTFWRQIFFQILAHPVFKT